MTPIISPWAFYLFHILSTLAGVATAIIIFGVVICIFIGIPLLDEDFLIEDDITLVKLRKHFKRTATAVVISAIALIFIPSEDTCYKMFISSYVTEDNIKKAGDTVEDLVDYIVDKAKELKEDN